MATLAGGGGGGGRGGGGGGAWGWVGGVCVEASGTFRGAMFFFPAGRGFS